MKQKTTLLALMAAGLLASACSGASLTDPFGANAKVTPDPGVVRTNQALSVPPNLQLRPPSQQAGFVPPPQPQPQFQPPPLPQNPGIATGAIPPQPGFAPPQPQFRPPPPQFQPPPLPQNAALPPGAVPPQPQFGVPPVPPRPGLPPQAIPGQPIPGQAIPGQPIPGQPIPGQPFPPQPRFQPPPPAFVAVQPQPKKDPLWRRVLGIPSEEAQRARNAPPPAPVYQPVYQPGAPVYAPPPQPRFQPAQPVYAPQPAPVYQQPVYQQQVYQQPGQPVYAPQPVYRAPPKPVSPFGSTVGDPYERWGISKTHPNGKKKTSRELDKELLAKQRAESRKPKGPSPPGRPGFFDRVKSVFN